MHEATILVIDDDRVDTETVLRAFERNNLVNPIQCARNGLEGLAILRREGDLAHLEGEPLPGVILLDLNMPQMNGLEFLTELKSDPDLKAIPVVVLTTSDDPRELESCYREGAAGYIVKPVDFPSFVEAIRTIGLYWSLCKTPRLSTG